MERYSNVGKRSADNNSKVSFFLYPTLFVLQEQPKAKRAHYEYEEESSVEKEVLDLIKKQSAEPKFRYKHPIAEEVDTLMSKLEEHGEQKMKVQLRGAIQALVNKAELELLDKLEG